MKRVPKLYYFKKDKDKEPYIIRGKTIVDEFTASLNNGIYRQINPNLPILEVGQEIETKEEPYAYFRYKKQVWPVYDDDPGQQSCIYLDGEWYGAGAYTTYPFDVEYFCYEIDSWMKRKNNE